MVENLLEPLENGHPFRKNGLATPLGPIPYTRYCSRPRQHGPVSVPQLSYQ